MAEILAAICSVDTETGKKFVDFNKIIPMPYNVYQGKLGSRERTIYGKLNWYDWSIENWGTSHNSYRFTQDGNEIGFQTSWTPPHKILEELTGMFPCVYITHEWAKDEIGKECGSREYLNGETVGEIIPENDREAFEFACSVWKMTPEECGYVLNASGTRYLNTEDDTEYEMVELFGIPAFFTNDRITDEDIPQGFYCYQLRFDDDLSEFATVEPRVAINHAGSVITTEPLDFGESGVLELTEENGINFMGAVLTMKEIIEAEKEALECAEEEGMTLG
ncbi:MAG: hypothetical protein IKI93_04495 [Clostridia bacterium]|nr:hypothetical protein [Clostridia bacterium]